MTQRYYNPQRGGCKRPTPLPTVNQPGVSFCSPLKQNILFYKRSHQKEKEMKPSLKRKVCSTNDIESCDKEKIHLLQPCNRIFIVLTSCLRLFWLSLHSWPSRRFTHSFFTIFLLKPPCLIARGFIY